MAHAGVEIRYSMNNNDDAVKASEAIRNTIYEATGDEAFSHEFRIDNNEVIVFGNEYSIYEDDYRELLEQITKKVAFELNNKSFSGISNYESMNCGAAEEHSFEYTNGILTIKSIYAPDGFEVCCPECGEIIGSFLDENGNISTQVSYHCDDCDSEFSLEDASCEVPQYEEKVIRIK